MRHDQQPTTTVRETGSTPVLDFWEVWFPETEKIPAQKPIWDESRPETTASG
jgi:hypothetical protein